MADLPPGATKKIIGEVVEEGLEKVTKEAVEELTEEGVEKITRAAAKDVTEEAIEHTTREAVEQATGQTVKDVAEEAGGAAGKQTDEVIGEVVKPAHPDNSLNSLNITTYTGADASMVELNARLEASKNAIESVCDLNSLPKIDVKAKELSAQGFEGITITVEGRYTPAVGADEPILVVNPKGPTPELTLAHETGHYIDDQAFGIFDPASGERLMGCQAALKKLLNPELQNAYDKVFEAITSSYTHSRLKDALYQAVKHNYPEAPYIENLLTREELFARGYAQYVATRSGNEILMDQVLEKAEPIYTLIHRAWPSDDFVAIDQAFDQLFRVTGMRK